MAQLNIWISIKDSFKLATTRKISAVDDISIENHWYRKTNIKHPIYKRKLKLDIYKMIANGLFHRNRPFRYWGIATGGLAIVLACLLVPSVSMTNARLGEFVSSIGWSNEANLGTSWSRLLELFLTIFVLFIRISCWLISNIECINLMYYITSLVVPLWLLLEWDGICTELMFRYHKVTQPRFIICELFNLRWWPNQVNLLRCIITWPFTL